MLVTLEGLDGSGKTTVWQTLQDQFPAATFTREPTDSWYGDAVYRSIEDDDADPLAELFLYMADHADHLARVVEPALKSGSLVVSDRYADSRVAYQGATLSPVLDEPLAYVQSIHDPISITPDLTLYLDVDPETATQRSDRANKFEQSDYLTSVRENYEELLATDPERFVRIDATQPPEAVVDDAVAAIDDQLEIERDG